MKANLTMSQLYYNASLMSFFFRKQASSTLLELLETLKAENSDFENSILFDRIEELYNDLDDVEELFYNESLETIRKEIEL